MGAGMVIRKMQERDIAAVAAIEKAVFSSPWSEKSFRDALLVPSNCYLVAETEGEVVGYCGFWVSFEIADLCNMAVAPQKRRQRIGGQILSEGIRMVQQRGAERVFLEVRESNRIAIGFYRKLGFQKIGIRKGYYDTPKEDALLMQSVLC